MLLKIWKDPVWSAVISAGIISLVAFVFYNVMPIGEKKDEIKSEVELLVSNILDAETYEDVDKILNKVERKSHIERNRDYLSRVLADVLVLYRPHVDMDQERRYIRRRILNLLKETSGNEFDKYLTRKALENTDLERMNFNESKLNDLSFNGAWIINSSFDNSDLANASFVGSSLRDVSFQGANVQGVDYSNSDWFNAFGLVNRKHLVVSTAALANCPNDIKGFIHKHDSIYYGVPFDRITDDLKDRLINQWKLLLMHGGICDDIRSN